MRWRPYYRIIILIARFRCSCIHLYQKCYFPMNPRVLLLVGWLVGRPFLNGSKLNFQHFYRSTCLYRYATPPAECCHICRAYFGLFSDKGISKNWSVNQSLPRFKIGINYLFITFTLCDMSRRYCLGKM